MLSFFKHWTTINHSPLLLFFATWNYAIPLLPLLLSFLFIVPPLILHSSDIAAAQIFFKPRLSWGKKFVYTLTVYYRVDVLQAILYNRWTKMVKSGFGKPGLRPNIYSTHYTETEWVFEWEMRLKKVDGTRIGQEAGSLLYYGY